MQIKRRLTILSPSSRRTAGKTMSSGTHNGWAPRRFPSDPVAAERLREWLLATDGRALDGVGLDFSGADMAGGDFGESWFTDAKLANVNLQDANFYRADLQGADLAGANLANSSLVRANLDDAVLRGANLDAVDFVKTSLYGVDASGASFRGARLMGASFLDVSLCGADLTDAVVQENSFQVRLDDDTILRGFAGSVFGPIEFVGEEGVQEIGGGDLARWIGERGGKVEVIPRKRKSGS
ncbi:pentapeptide repeat-containing protein [Streptomyces lydicus]|uniref:pentapeptide repeat-containing protein n=1 Tax=Streptomyces lydicus TaxID=47763 RepID=UPI0037B438B8